MIKIDLSGIEGFCELPAPEPAQKAELFARTLPMSGWYSLPSEMTSDALRKISEAGRRISETSDALVVIGAGGSSLGARALTDALCRNGVREIFYAGDNLSGEALSRQLKALEDKEFSVIVTSKSGTTTEPAAALRVFLKLLRERYGDDMRSHLYVVAGDGPSPLRTFAEELGCGLFGIPESVGGRYSVLTASGLLPAAACGLDIEAVVSGAAAEMETGAEAALSYAAARQALCSRGFSTELFATFEPSSAALGDWWRQLFGESEGKNARGIFPSTVRFSGDLHSMGQYIQQGPRNLFETLVSFGKTDGDVAIPDNSEFDDGFDFLVGRSLSSVNEIALDAVKAAHISGGVPVLEVHAPGLDEASLGALLYFFERACAASSVISGVNPFDQPGVEAYKKRMLAILRKEK